MDARYKRIRNLVSTAIAFALTGVLLWGILDGGAATAWAGVLAMVGR